MGIMQSLARSFQPFSMVPPGALPSRATESVLHTPTPPSVQPKQIVQYPAFGPFTPAGVWEREGGRQFLQGRWMWPASTVQITQAPYGTVDMGTYAPFTTNGPGPAGTQPYAQPARGT